jgi:hypothetical protein
MEGGTDMGLGIDDLWFLLNCNYLLELEIMHAWLMLISNLEIGQRILITECI